MTASSLRDLRRPRPRLAPIDVHPSGFRLVREDLSGGPVAYADFGGQGPTMVLVHGLGGCHLNWLPAAPLLARHARVLAVDLVGFGRTEAAGRSHGIEAQRAMLEEFLAEVVREPAVLVGNSMGGLLCLQHAARAKEQVSGLVLVSPALPPPWGARLDPAMIASYALRATPGVGELAMWLESRRRGARGLFLDQLTLGTSDVRRVPPEVVEANVSLIEDRVQRRPFGHAQSYLDASRSLLWHLAHRSRIEGWVQGVRADTLVLHGADDRLVPSACALQLGQARRDWTVEILSGLGHVPQMEDAPRFVERVVTWLRGNEVEGASRAA
ncbi:Putative alpha/beta hydrolase superfamily protein [Minicystis rosea]|nr:Putative alpha/beta hydrolase superfamily protein [Minicystis rosea]